MSQVPTKTLKGLNKDIAAMPGQARPDKEILARSPQKHLKEIVGRSGHYERKY